MQSAVHTFRPLGLPPGKNSLLGWTRRPELSAGDASLVVAVSRRSSCALHRRCCLTALQGVRGG